MACGAWQSQSQVIANIINLAKLVGSIGGGKPEFVEYYDVNPYESKPIERELAEFRVTELQRINKLPRDERREARQRLRERISEYESRIN